MLHADAVPRDQRDKGSSIPDQRRRVRLDPSSECSSSCPTLLEPCVPSDHLPTGTKRRSPAPEQDGDPPRPGSRLPCGACQGHQHQISSCPRPEEPFPSLICPRVRRRSTTPHISTGCM